MFSIYSSNFQCVGILLHHVFSPMYPPCAPLGVYCQAPTVECGEVGHPAMIGTLPLDWKLMKVTQDMATLVLSSNKNMAIDGTFLCANATASTKSRYSCK